MIGVFYGLTAAATWGLSNVFLKAQVGRLPTKQLLAIRALAGVAIALFAYLILGRRDELGQLMPWAWLALVGVVLSGYFGADLVFTYALEDLPISNIFPIQASYPLIAAGLAWYLFDETISILMIFGFGIVIVGLSLIISEENSQIRSTKSSKHLRGYLLTILSALGWGISAILLRDVLENYDPITVNVGVALITATSFLLISRFPAAIFAVVKEPGTGAGIILAGILGGTGISNLLFIIALQIAGVALATVLVSVAPLFTSLFAMLFLGERLTSRLALGTVLTVIGIGVFIGG